MAQGNTPDAICLDSSEKVGLDCPVCLQTCIHPARLPCGHIFCFLCVKGVANINNRCALCRADIPIDFLDHPCLVPNCEEPEPVQDEYQWFYEGRNGWWQYDKRTSQEIESSYAKNEKNCELLIAGFIYVIDFESMMQIRRNEPHRKRQIKRDVSTIPKKGVAGIRTEGCTDNENYNVETNNRVQFPELLETNIAYQNLDHTDILDNTGDDSENENEVDNDNTQVIINRLPPDFINVQLSRESVDGIEFDNFIINRIRSLHISRHHTSDNEE